jgi:hypothetical protein
MEAAPFKERGAMCAKCGEIDPKIIRYKRIASQVNEKVLQDGLAGLLTKMLAEKALFHPESDKIEGRLKVAARGRERELSGRCGVSRLKGAASATGGHGASRGRLLPDRLEYRKR